MRRGIEPEILTVDGKFYGINLGFDYVAEHEFGVRKLKDLLHVGSDFQQKTMLSKIFGKQKPLIGVERRVIRNFPEDIVFFEKVVIEGRNYFAFLFNSNFSQFSHLVLRMCQIFPHDKSGNIFTAWDDESFGIVVSDKYENEIHELYEAFKNLNVCITFGKNRVSNEAGLVFNLRSMLSEEEIQTMYDDDVERLNMVKEFKKQNGKGKKG